MTDVPSVPEPIDPDDEELNFEGTLHVLLAWLGRTVEVEMAAGPVPTMAARGTLERGFGVAGVEVGPHEAVRFTLPEWGEDGGFFLVRDDFKFAELWNGRTALSIICQDGEDDYHLTVRLVV